MKRIGVLTSGGDAQGMNAALRAVVRAGLDRGAEVYAIYEGYQGLVDGGDLIRPITWNGVGGILQMGGTIIGTARSAEFRTREGRVRAVNNLIKNGIDGLIVIGGDGSLTGADTLRTEWPSIMQELLDTGQITRSEFEKYPYLAIAGMVGSIDNDMWGTDITIGADSALHRITYAVDCISSTAASHQRAFVVEVMGRNSGYLALMSALATGADWALIPESPPDVDRWEDKMCEVLKAGRAAGRRDSIVIVAEGAIDRNGNPISAEYVRQVLEEQLHEDVRTTILGHVQRGGAPSAYDRTMSTLVGVAAVDEILSASADSTPQLIGMKGNRVTRLPLMECVEKTRAINVAIKERNFTEAMDLRGGGFKESFHILRTLVRALPHDPKPGQRRLTLAVLTASAPAPGMNTALRAAVRLGLDRGHHILGVNNSFLGLINDDMHQFKWMDVDHWASMGGSELGTNRHVPSGKDFYAIARTIEERQIDGLLIIGGWAGYNAAMSLLKERENFPSFQIPIACLPASINNNLPGSELSVGADTALNNIVDAVNKIKQSAVASRRCFVVEVMGKYCGYLALMSMLATGAERAYLHEEGVTLKDLYHDVRLLNTGFEHGKRLGVMIRNERAHPLYTTQFMSNLFEAEGGDLYEVRMSVLGHLQQGGDPTPFDRILATRYAYRCIRFLEEEALAGRDTVACLGVQGSKYHVTPLEEVIRRYDAKHERPKEQWWMDLRPIAQMLAQPGPQYYQQDHQDVW
ncbi:MAG: 6-phosphofructokinase [Chloroflexota bacterium]|jgi:6-phosphofructokinase 1|nr:MAG: 6-phosphofructokinase [Chloroflexota bacterium]